MLTDEYASILTETIDMIRSTQRPAMLRAAAILAETIKNDGLIHIFGCGHSHILAEECFYRAGGLACVSPIFYEPLMLHKGAANSSVLEKKAGLAGKVLSMQCFSSADSLICVSTSGVNAVPVELADKVREKGIPVIGIASDHYMQQEARNPLGLHLQEVCDVCIHNGAPHGDACLSHEKLTIPFTPVSTITGSFIINCLLAEAINLAVEDGVDVPLYLSGNIPGGAERNESLIRRFQPRIPAL